MLDRILRERGFTERPRRMEPGYSPDYSVYAFGFKIIGTVVRMYTGDICHGARAPVSATGPLGETPTYDATITEDHQYIWVSYDWGIFAYFFDGGFSDTPSTTKPQTDATRFRVWIARFRLIDGVVSLEQIGHLGNIQIPGAMA